VGQGLQMTSWPGAAAHAAGGKAIAIYGGNVKVLSKVQVLAERNGWSIARAQGFVDGEMFRRRGAAPSTYTQVGIDDYSLGFRAGYYERGNSQPKSATTPLGRPLKDIPVARAQSPEHHLVHLDVGHQDDQNDEASAQLA
jgi:hypothetical protein